MNSELGIIWCLGVDLSLSEVGLAALAVVVAGYCIARSKNFRRMSRLTDSSVSGSNCMINGIFHERQRRELVMTISVRRTRLVLRMKVAQFCHRVAQRSSLMGKRLPVPKTQCPARMAVSIRLLVVT